MKKVLFIAAIITLGLALNSCESDSNLTQEEKQELLNLTNELYSRDGDTGKDESVNTEGDGSETDTDNSED